jgi:hypothetical protein
MQTEIYFVFGEPGSGTTMLSRLVHSVLDDGIKKMHFNIGYSFTQPCTIWDSDFFYNYLEVPTAGVHIITVGFPPQFDILRTKFPGCKLIQLTNDIYDIEPISKNFADKISSYEIIGGPVFFSGILEANPNIFSNTTATVYTDLSEVEKAAFIKCVEFSILNQGIWKKEVPASDDLLQIPFKTFWKDTDQTLTMLSNFLDRPVDEEITQYYQTAATQFVTDYLS